MTFWKTESQRILDLKGELAKARKIIEIQQAEIDSLAAIVARDRARVTAETARFNRERAEAESNERDYESSRRLRA